ncbi:MAG TPA: hypothetical protein VNS57_01410 [Steroidobacteraceae bacterium]|nr:hypothetical protein [Steroidobacteraceae bacterium]
MSGSIGKKALGAWLVSLVLGAPSVTAAAPAATTTLAFPGAQGWAATTPGGRGGKILKVTTLEPRGPGSLLEALEAKGPRIVVFEVGGVIDLNRETVRIREPYVTIAGQTAPAPGITLIRGGVDILTHDVIVQHLRVRPGSAGFPKFGGDFDAISTINAHDVIVDHCSLTWATDENLSASGTRFPGKTPAEWRQGTSHRITFSNNLVAEGLANSTHPKGEHSKGSLIHDNVADILIVGNLYAQNYERSVLFKGGTRGMMVNNLIYGPGPRAVHYNLIAEEWRGQPYQLGRIAAIGNVLRAGPSTPPDLAFMMLGGSGDLEWYADDNVAVDRLGRPLPQFARYTTAPVAVKEVARPELPFGVKLLPSAEVQDAVIREAGARPWDRDPHDARIVADVIEGRGRIIDSEQEVGGYPVVTPTRQAFDPAKWNLGDMTPR